jgi:hypothetical protein
VVPIRYVLDVGLGDVVHVAEVHVAAGEGRSVVGRQHGERPTASGSFDLLAHRVQVRRVVGVDRDEQVGGLGVPQAR